LGGVAVAPKVKSDWDADNLRKTLHEIRRTIAAVFARRTNDVNLSANLRAEGLASGEASVSALSVV
jgi:hypothetical protein